MRNALIEQLARERVADLARAADAARMRRGEPHARRDGLLASVRALLARRSRDARPTTHGSMPYAPRRRPERDPSPSRGTS